MNTLDKNSQRISKITFFINGFKGKGINYLSGKDDWKQFDKNNPANAVNVFCVKKWKHILPTSQNKTQIIKNNSLFDWFQTEKDGIIFQ